MYHSVNIGDKNTWDDWCLIPEEQIIIPPPAQKTNFIDIPGASGSLDMSEALTGYPTFSNRTGSMSFLIMNNYQTNLPQCNPKRVHKLAEDIMEYLHGKKFKMILEDDPLYYYEGRFTLGEVTPDPNWSKLSIEYNLNPYKWSIFNSVDTEWLWDPFSFVDGFIYRGLFADVELEGTLNTAVWQYINLNRRMMGDAPMLMTFTCRMSENNTYGRLLWSLTLEDRNGKKEYTNLTYETITPEDFVFHGQNVTIGACCYGGGFLDISFRPGRL